MRVGGVGLGRMGAPMARNLARAGHAVTLRKRTARGGEEIAATPAAFAAGAGVVASVLADDGSSGAVHLDADGLFAGDGGPTSLEVGTSSPHHLCHLRYGAPAGRVP